MPKVLGRVEFFSTFIIFMASLKISKLPNIIFFIFLGNFSPKSLQTWGFFKFPKFWTEIIKFSTYIICPKFSGNIKILKPLKYFGQHRKTNPKFPQAAQINPDSKNRRVSWKNRQRPNGFGQIFDNFFHKRKEKKR